MKISTKHKRSTRDPVDALYRKRNKALQRVMALCKDPDIEEEELNKALDVLTIAHTAVTFEWASGRHEW